MENTAFLIDETKAKLNTHEAVCELRYDSICSRLKRIETILITIRIRSTKYIITWSF